MSHDDTAIQPPAHERVAYALASLLTGRRKPPAPQMTFGFRCPAWLASPSILALNERGGESRTGPIVLSMLELSFQLALAFLHHRWGAMSLLLHRHDIEWLLAMPGTLTTTQLHRTFDRASRGHHGESLLHTWRHRADWYAFDIRPQTGGSKVIDFRRWFHSILLHRSGRSRQLVRGQWWLECLCDGQHKLLDLTMLAADMSGRGRYRRANASRLFDECLVELEMSRVAFQRTGHYVRLHDANPPLLDLGNLAIQDRVPHHVPPDISAWHEENNPFVLVSTNGPDWQGA